MQAGGLPEEDALRQFLVLSMLTGCGFSTGIDPSTALSALTEEEICQLSDAAVDYTDRKLSDTTSCYINAQVFAAQAVAEDAGVDFVAECELVFEICQDAILEVVPDACDPADVGVFPASCASTVGDYEDCIAAEVTDLKRMARMRCDTSAEAVEEALEQTPPECDALLSEACSG